jgi:hypothetical protein
LPPRLRERLQAGDRNQNIRASRATGWLIGIGALAAVVVAVLFTLRGRVASNASGSHASGTSTASAPANTTPTTAGVEPGPAATTPEKPTSSQPPAAASSGAGKVAAAVPVGASVASGASVSAGASGTAAPAAAPAEPAVPKNLYGVAVATFIVDEKANTEKARLAGVTGLPARVVASKTGDFTVVVGAFTSKSNAETAAGDLIDKGQVEEARVVPFPNPAYKPASK